MLRTAVLCTLWASVVLSAPLNKDRQKLLLISFDGFRWDYDLDVDTPNLDQMAKDGVKALYVTPPYLTITSPTHFTLLTGNSLSLHLHHQFFSTPLSASRFTEAVFCRTLHREPWSDTQHVVQHNHTREEAVLYDSVCEQLVGQRLSAHLDHSSATGL